MGNACRKYLLWMGFKSAFVSVWPFNMVRLYRSFLFDFFFVCQFTWESEYENRALMSVNLQGMEYHTLTSIVIESLLSISDQLWMMC